MLALTVRHNMFSTFSIHLFVHVQLVSNQMTECHEGAMQGYG